MKLFKKLNSRGFEHVTVMAVFLVGFALVGVYFLVKSHAATYNYASGYASRDCVKYTLKLNDKGTCVSFAQQYLNNFRAGISTDGIFGNGTQTAVKNFQSTSCLSSDGVIGSATWDALLNKRMGGKGPGNYYNSCFTNKSIVGLGSGKCLDVYGARTTNSTMVDIYSCVGAANQKWTFQSDGSIKGVQSGKCLDVYGAGTANGTAVDIYTCVGGATNQKWMLMSDGSLVSESSYKCLDVYGQYTANGTKTDIYNCVGTSNQRWSIQ